MWFVWSNTKCFILTLSGLYRRYKSKQVTNPSISGPTRFRETFEWSWPIETEMDLRLALLREIRRVEVVNHWRVIHQSRDHHSQSEYSRRHKTRSILLLRAPPSATHPINGGGVLFLCIHVRLMIVYLCVYIRLCIHMDTYTLVVYMCKAWFSYEFLQLTYQSELRLNSWPCIQGFSLGP